MIQTHVTCLQYSSCYTSFVDGMLMYTLRVPIRYMTCPAGDCAASNNYAYLFICCAGCAVSSSVASRTMITAW
jgi:hypothetical protein